MAVHELVRPLLGVELFNGLKPLQITEILRRADRIVYKPGDVIIKSDAQGDAAVLIVAGDAVRIASPHGSDQDETVIPTGALLGEMAMLIETAHSSTIVAKSPVRALKLSRVEMHAHMANDPTLADHLVQRIAARLHRIAGELREVDDHLNASLIEAALPKKPINTVSLTAAIAEKPNETRH